MMRTNIGMCRCAVLWITTVRNICNSGTSVPVNPLLIVLNGRHLKINVHHFMWTTGGCHDNQACFCVTGGQLSLCQRRGREGGREMVENEGGSDEEKRVNAGMNSLNDCILLFYRLFLLQNLLLNVYAVLSNNYFFIHTHSGQCNHSATRSFHHHLVFRMQWPLTEDSKSWPSGNKTVFLIFRQ